MPSQYGVRGVFAHAAQTGPPPIPPSPTIDWKKKSKKQLKLSGFESKPPPIFVVVSFISKKPITSLCWSMQFWNESILCILILQLQNVLARTTQHYSIHHNRPMCETTYEEIDLGPQALPRYLVEARCSGSCAWDVGTCSAVHISDQIYQIASDGTVDTSRHVKRSRAVACVCKVPRNIRMFIKSS